MSEPLEWTGERLTTSVFNELTIEHLHRYALACEYSKDKTVLDIASGEGYGADLLARNSRQVVGVDIDEATINFSKKKYQAKNLSFIKGSVTQIPLENENVDLVVSFETIEHIADHEKMLNEIKRVLKKNGVLILSTPDKLNKALESSYENKYHIKELSKDEFKILVGCFFKHCIFLNQKSLLASVLTPENFSGQSFTEYEGDYTTIRSSGKLFNTQYNLCIASDFPLEIPGHSIFSHKNVLDNIRNEKNEVYNSKTYKAGNLLAKSFRLIRGLFRK